MKIKKRLFLVVMILNFIMGTLTAANNKKLVTITDNVGRKVEISVPVKRAVVTLRYNNELIRACGAIDKVIAVDMNTAQDRKYWSNFNVEDAVGKNQKSLNYEKIIKLKPEVVILPSNGVYKEAEKKLAPFGIKVIVISGYDTNDFHNQVKNIGIIFGKEKQAKKFEKYYNEPLEYIQKKLKGVKKRTVYWEDAKDYYTSFPGSYYYNMIAVSGGENVFENVGGKVNVAQVDSEAVISRNPDVIVKNISLKSVIKGTGVYQAPSKEQMEEAIKSIKKRKAWRNITAVKNNDIYLMSQFGHGGASKMIGAVYMAKWIYPDILTDLYPDEIFKVWLEEYQGFKNIKGHFYPNPVNNKQ